MRSNAARNYRTIGSNRGVSLVEFVGCLAALGGGIVLGSMYLGVDVKAMAFGILEKADIDLPAIMDIEATTSIETLVEEPSSVDNTESVSEEEASETDSNFEEADQQPLDETDTGAEATTDDPEPKELTDAEKLVATKACWAALNRCVQEEIANRSKSIRDPGNWQLFDYLLHRKEGHQKVVETIEQLDQHGVDPRLTAHVQQVLAWHRAGAELFDRATHLLTDAPAGRLSGPFAQSWQSAATQHRMEEKLIVNKHKAVASYLEHTHKKTAAAPATD